MATFFGSAGDDTVIGDYVFMDGGLGNDVLQTTHPGEIILLGGGDWDFVSIDYINSPNTFGFLSGGPGNDVVYGGAGKDEITGRQGDDYVVTHGHGSLISGAGGSDRLVAGEGASDVVIQGAGGNDKGTITVRDENRQPFTVEAGLYGSAGNDELFGGGGDDLLVGGLGQDHLEGGPGNDEIFGGAGKDKIIARSGDDRIVAEGHGSRVFGGSGDDVLIAGDGSGDVILHGAVGEDVFRFVSSVENLPSGSDRAFIKDFDRSEDDRIDLSPIDANQGASGDQAFKWIGGKGFHDRAGELRFKDGIVEADTDGDGHADLEIKVHIAGPDRLGENDFVL